MFTAGFYRHIAIPLVDIARRTESIADHRQLDRSQWLPPEELRNLQIHRLKALLSHAGEHVPYYRKLFSDIGFSPGCLQSVDDLHVIPFLTKDIIRSNQDLLIADNAARFKPRPHRSAGTTGQPIVIQMDRRRHSVAWADMYRWWSAGGWQLGDRQFVLAGAALRPRQLSGLRAALYGRLNHFVEFSSFDLTSKMLEDVLRRLSHANQKVFLRGYASSIYELARYAQKINWSGRVDAVFTTAETLFSDQRRVIENALHTRVFDQWGCRDGGISAFECSEHSGLHLAIENAVVELVKDNIPVPDGEAGEVVATDLFSYAMPIIRYKVGDIAAMKSGICSCGRGLPLIASVEGRVSNFIVASGGRRIHGEFFSHVFWSTPWVRQFQIVQDSVDEIIVKIETLRMPDQRETEYVRSIIQDQTGPQCQARIEFVTDIPVGPMGKRQFIICKVPAE